MDWTKGEMTARAAEILRKATALHTALIAWANTSMADDFLNCEAAWDANLALEGDCVELRHRIEEAWEKQAPCCKKAG